MLFLEARCPHCLKERRGIKIFAISEYITGETIAGIEKRQVKEATFCSTSAIRYAKAFGAGYCVFCRGPLLAELKCDLDYLHALREYVEKPDILYQGPLPEIAQMWPEAAQPYAHPAIPEAIRIDFAELQQMLLKDFQPHWIIGGCRSVLESAVKQLGGEGPTLCARIENLKSKAVIAGVLLEWAQHIRRIGNDAVHEREGTPAEAAELVEFTRLFLQYAFEFPARIREARKT